MTKIWPAVYHRSPPKTNQTKTNIYNNSIDGIKGSWNHVENEQVDNKWVMTHNLWLSYGLFHSQKSQLCLFLRQ